MKKKADGLRKTFAVREILRVGLMAEGEPYFSSKVGRGRSYILDMVDYRSGHLEDEIFNALDLVKGDKVEFFLTARKVAGKRA